MKYLIALLLAFSLSALAQETPKFLKDAVITVTLKNGKTYSYSANEYAVIKRSSKPQVKAEVASAASPAKADSKEASKRNKHIISGEIVRSNSGEFETSSSASTIDVKTKKELGLGLQYQYNFVDDLYIGGRVDSNGGAAANIGLGF